MDRLQWVALAAAAMQAFFAYRELFGWGDDFVALAAPEWVGRKKAADVTSEDREHRFVRQYVIQSRLSRYRAVSNSSQLCPRSASNFGSGAVLVLMVTRR